MWTLEFTGVAGLEFTGAIRKGDNMFIWSFFTKVGKLLKAAFGAAHDNGFTDDLLDLALSWVKVAAQQAFTDNKERREFVVKILMNKGFSESLARLAVELAVQLLKRQLKRLDR